MSYPFNNSFELLSSFYWKRIRRISFRASSFVSTAIYNKYNEFRWGRGGMVWIICNKYWTSCKNYPTLIETIIYKLDFFTIPYIQYFRHRICWNYITCHIFIITSNTICNIWHFFVNVPKKTDTYWQKNWQTVTSCGFVTFYKLKNHFFQQNIIKLQLLLVINFHLEFEKSKYLLFSWLLLLSMMIFCTKRCLRIADVGCD